MEDLEVVGDDNKIGNDLIKLKILAKEQVDEILKKQNDGDERLFGEIAIGLGYINEDALLKYLESKKN